MNERTQHVDSGPGHNEYSAGAEFSQTLNFHQGQAQLKHAIWPIVDAGQSLEKISEALVASYLDVNQNFRNIPLKEFMDDLERNILLSCLRMTHGSQRNAATLLGLKPTALFEKMRKHRINGRQIKLSEKLQLLHPRERA